MAAAARKKKRPFVPKRGQVVKRVLGTLFSWAWLPRCSRLQQLFRRNRARRGNRVPANRGHVEPEPDVANAVPAPAPAPARAAALG